MTNGEKIQSIFPNMNFGTLAQDDVIVNKDYSNNDEPQVFIPKRVWNAEYKEPTTRNCFGCKYSKDNHNAGTEECHLCMWENQYTPTTKDDLGVDCVARKDVERFIEGFINEYTSEEELEFINLELDGLKHLPSVAPLSSPLEKNSKKLEKDFGELDCISRADVNQLIEDYMDEQYHVLSDRTRERAFGAKAVKARINELPSVPLQEPILDKIRAEIEEYIDCMRWDSESLIKLEAINYVLKLIDKYKAESEVDNGNDDN